MSDDDVAAVPRTTPGLESARLITMSGWDDLLMDAPAQRIDFYRKLRKPLPIHELKAMIEAE